MDKYSHIASKDEYDEGTRSLENYEKEKEVKSAFHTKYEDEIQDVREQQGLLPRGRKTTRHNHQYVNTNRPIERSRSKEMY